MYAGAYYHVPIVDSCMLGISTLLRLWVPTVATFHPVIQDAICAAVVAVLVVIAGTVCASNLSFLFRPWTGDMEAPLRQRQRKARKVKIT